MNNDIALDDSDHTKYNFFDRENLDKGQLAIAIVEKYMTEHPNFTFEELKTTFPDTMMGDKSLIGLIVRVEDVEKAPYSYKKKAYGFFKANRKYKDVDGVEFYVSNWWDITNVQHIIDFAEQQGWSVEIQG